MARNIKFYVPIDYRIYNIPVIRFEVSYLSTVQTSPDDYILNVWSYGSWKNRYTTTHSRLMDYLDANNLVEE